VLGYDLLLKSGEDTERSRRAASLIVSLATLEERLQRGDFDRREVVGVAGLGCAGETAALVFAGSLTLEDAILLGDARAAALSLESESSSSSSCCCSLIGLERGLVDELCAAHDLTVTHELFGRGFLLSGRASANVDALEAACSSGTAKIQRLETPHITTRSGGGVHTRDALPAAGAYAAAIAESGLSAASCAVYLGVGSDDVAPLREASELQAALLASLTQPVRWHACCARMLRDGATHFVEAGLSNHLANFLKLIDDKAKVLIDHHRSS
jgi:[acyl-carrier-protein] S-malonyltransferase